MFNVIFLIFFYFVYNKIYSLNLQRVGVFFPPWASGIPCRALNTGVMQLNLINLGNVDEGLGGGEDWKQVRPLL